MAPSLLLLSLVMKAFWILFIFTIVSAGFVNAHARSHTFNELSKIFDLKRPQMDEMSQSSTKSAVPDLLGDTNPEPAKPKSKSEGKKPSSAPAEN